MKFNKYPLRITVAIALIFSTITIKAQLNIQYYNADDLQYPNSTIVSISEMITGDLFLLCENSDMRYQNHQVRILKTNASGDLSKNEIGEVKNLVSLVKIIPSQDNQWNIYGNTDTEGTFNATSLQIDAFATISSEKNEANSFSTKLNDVCKNTNDDLLLVYTKIGKSGKHNIELKQTSSSGEVNWLKAISSENNEEASMMKINNENEIFILGKKYNDELTSYVAIMYKVDAKGNNIWKKGIESTGVFYNQFFSINQKGNILYACSYTKNQSGISETKIIELSSEGMVINETIITDFTANGLSCLDENQSILYGSEFLVNSQQVVTKGKYVIINEKLESIKTRALNNKDKPDSDLSKQVITSSDFNTIKVLQNGNIALGGKIYMPINNSTNERSNHPFLVIIPKTE